MLYVKKIIKNITLILLSLLSITLCGCAHIDRTYISTDITGTWEPTNFGYFFLNIQEGNQGYIGFATEGDYVEVCKITDIKYMKGKFILTLQGYGEADELEKIEGFLIGDNMLSLSEAKNENNANSDISEDSLIFLRESIIPDLKQSVKEKLKQIQDGNTLPANQADL
jgi:hypothetical protein